MAASMRSTRFVMSMRRTRPRSELSPQKLKAERPHALGHAGVAGALVAAAALRLVGLVHQITTTGARARMAANAFSWFRSDWPTYMLRSGPEAHAEHAALVRAKHSAR